jgi:hypothetical protein
MTIAELLLLTGDAWAEYESETTAHGMAPERERVRRGLWDEFWLRSTTLEVAMKATRNA